MTIRNFKLFNVLTVDLILRNLLFCIITLIGNEGGPVKGSFEFVRLGMLAPMLIRLICGIYPGVDSCITMLKMPCAGSYHFLDTIRSGSIVQKKLQSCGC